MLIFLFYFILFFQKKLNESSQGVLVFCLRCPLGCGVSGSSFDSTAPPVCSKWMLAYALIILSFVNFDAKMLPELWSKHLGSIRRKANFEMECCWSQMLTYFSSIHMCGKKPSLLIGCFCVCVCSWPTVISHHRRVLFSNSLKSTKKNHGCHIVVQKVGTFSFQGQLTPPKVNAILCCSCQHESKDGSLINIAFEE